MRDLSGQTFGSYRLEEPLGRGGMGEVYRARHLRLTNRSAAVKVLPSSLAAEPDFLRRFEQEANSAAALDHPNILPIWDYGEQDGIPYLAMPLVPGGSLKELLEERGPLPLDQAEAFLRQIGDALDYAHARGIIHRDVKPANILLRDDGRPLLADFGIAKAIEEGQTQGLTRAGTGVGTPEYMAPEQIEGKAVAASDLYSLGVMLYQMLTGEVPYSGGTPYEIAYKQMYTPPPPLGQTAPHLPPAIEQVLERALAKAPQDRFASGRGFAAAFSDALAGAGLDTVVSGDPHDQRTTPLIAGAAAPADATRALPHTGTPPPRPYDTHRGATGVSPPATPPPARSERRSTRWPLILAGTIGAALVLCIGGFGAFAAFNGRNADRPTATADPRNARTTPVVAIDATGTAVFATANAGAFQGTAVFATVNANATRSAEFFANATATAEARGIANETATIAAEATAEVRTATAEAASVSATTAAEARAGTAQARAVAQTATAGANATAAVNSTATAEARATAQTATAEARSVGQTATAGVRPTPTRAPTAPPTRPAPTAGAPTAAANPPPANWGPPLAPLSGGKTYTDARGRFSFSLPQDWTETTSSGAEIAFDAPATAARMNVALNSVPASTTIEVYNDAVDRNLKRDYPDYALVSLDKVLIDNRPAYKRISRITTQGVQVQVAQIYFLENGVGHELSFAALPENFARQAAVFDGIAGSYKVGR